jgi:triphosphoribosyl-dephospho-CoA synthetase
MDVEGKQMKTVKQIAETTGIDKQAIYRYLRKNNVECVSRKNGVKQFSETVEAALLKGFKDDTVSQTVSHDTVYDTVIEVLREELRKKDDLIETLSETLRNTQTLLAVYAQNKLIEHKEKPKRKFLGLFG